MASFTNQTEGFYYACGRNDAQDARWVNPWVFAEFYDAQRATEGRSVQDAFEEFLART